PTWDELETQLGELLPLTAPDSTLILLLNKRDLLTEREITDWLSHCSDQLQRMNGKPHTTPPLAISARAAQGIEALEELMVTSAQPLHSDEETVMLYNLRHYEALTKASRALELVSEGLHNGLTSDLITPYLREAIEEIGLVTGASITSDEVLGFIFSHFCIGK
ncbi:MAG: tRNA uridine-5-carboxymethylaminomethyl(34) synthesis GTPase MnmE, partial [Bacteroidales bacterium]|nr:tRNA uridine-5-carboxymethylaminomethyl(34) synthesis GTPase MnmE [Bacteroidales bacterium]